MFKENDKMEYENETEKIYIKKLNHKKKPD